MLGTDATREMTKEALAAKNGCLWMAQESAFDAAKRLGIGLDLVTEAAMGNADALKEVQAQINAGADGSLEYANAAVTIERAVSGESDSIERAIDAATQKQEADGKSVSRSEEHTSELQ